MRKYQIISAFLCLLTASSPAYASDCKSFGQVASDAWKEFRARAIIDGCATETSSKLARYHACGLGRFVTSMPTHMVGWYNAYVGKNGPLQLGPRSLSSDGQSGELLFGASRRFVSTVPMFSASTHVALKKVSGKANVAVTICALTEDGSSTKLTDETVDASSKDSWQWTFPKLDNVMLMVRLDSQSPAAKFQYQISAETKSDQVSSAPVRGFADVHVHQISELGHGGNWYGGHHTGSRETALTSCTERDHAWAPFIPPGERIKHGKPLVDWPAWDDMGHHQIYRDWLKSAHARGLNLMVASPTNNQVLCTALKLKYRATMGCGDAEAVERQIIAIHKFAEENHDWYEVALTPWHARQIIANGKLAVVISPESSDQFTKAGGDWQHQVENWYRMGVRSLQLAHLTDTPFAGVAKQGAAALAIPNVIKNPTHAFATDRDGENKIGLTKTGASLLDFMVAHHMLVDGAHSSLRAWDDIFAYMRDKHAFYPVYDSHSRFESLMTPDDLKSVGEMRMTTAKAAYIKKLGGLMGVTTRPRPAIEVSGGIKDSCPGSTTSFAQHYLRARALGIKMTFGSDFNGFTNQLKPRFGQEGCTPKAPTASSRSGHTFSREYVEYLTKGLAHMGYLPEVLEDLRELGVDTSALDSSAETYLQMWERAWAANRKESM